MTISIEREAWVCVDCYHAHHGYNDHLDQDGTITGSDRVAMGEIEDHWHVFDNTCSNHDGDDDQACSHCRQEGTENGIRTFSGSRCDGCGSRLAGERFRLALAREVGTHQ